MLVAKNKSEGTTQFKTDVTGIEFFGNIKTDDYYGIQIDGEGIGKEIAKALKVTDDGKKLGLGTVRVYVEVIQPRDME